MASLKLDTLGWQTHLTLNHCIGLLVMFCDMCLQISLYTCVKVSDFDEICRAIRHTSFSPAMYVQYLHSYICMHVRMLL